MTTEGQSRTVARRPAPQMRPVLFRWQPGITEYGAMVVDRRFAPLCADQFEPGEDYVLEVAVNGSTPARRWFFAAINEIWSNLPERVAPQFPKPIHLRKWCMVQCGYCTESDTVLETHRDAMAAAALIRNLSAYSVIVVSGNVVKRFDALSTRGMRKAVFDPMSREVTDLARSMTGTTHAQLRIAARQGANQ